VTRATFRLILLLVLFAALALWFVSVRDSGRRPAVGRTVMGEGPTIVIVPGLGSGVDHWLPVARRLSHGHRVVLMDLPGRGATPMPDSLTLESAALALDAVLAEESGPVTLVGHSLGGLVAVQEALVRPERVRALVLIETALRPQGSDAERAAMARRLDTDYAGLVRDAYESFGRDSAQGRMLADQVAALPMASIKPWIQLALTIDVSVRMSHLRKPLLAVLSDRSWPSDETWEHAAAELGYGSAPDVEPVRVNGAGHFVMLDQPERIASLIERFAEQPGQHPLAAR
jgi:pimeloyl-[acyl-carrier protein] methyl ester esterase